MEATTVASHVPVLLEETIESLDIRDGGTYLDFTLGRGGHSKRILARIPHGRLIAFDQDEEAIKESEATLREVGDNFTLIRDNFRNFDSHLKELGIEKVSGILIDLGVSSPQLDEGDRGFSYKLEAPLDMRMDQSQGLTAHEVVNNYSLSELTRVIREYGEDKEAYQIAKKIVSFREKKPIETTTELAEIIKSAKPRQSLVKKGHPAKQAFQAIRIEVNDEEGALIEALKKAPGYLEKGGRLAIISFMSLDDRLVKQCFNKLTRVEGSRTGYERPEEIKEAEYRLVYKKPIIPGERELAENHRAASSKLRVIEKL